MKKIIVGKENVDYISKKTNEPVKGITLHTIGADQRVQGHACETIFISIKSPMYEQVLNYPIESEITVQYNRWGSVESVLLVEKK